MKKTLLSLFLLISAFVTANAQQEVRVHLADGTTKTWKVWEVESIDFMEEDPLPAPAPDAPVDLGLSVKWATCNLGADAESKSGHYYGWGEVSGLNKSKDLKYYPYPGISQEISASVYDMATAAWGELWRLPSQEEFQELMDKCEWEAVEGGFNVTSKVNGASIFLPFVNYREGKTEKEQSGLHYWTGDIADDKTKAVCLSSNASATDSVVTVKVDTTFVSESDFIKFENYLLKSNIQYTSDEASYSIQYEKQDTISTYKQTQELGVMPRYMGLVVRPVYGKSKKKFDIVVKDITCSFNKASISASLVNPDDVVGYGIRLAKDEAELFNDKKCFIDIKSRNQDGQDVDNPTFDLRNLEVKTKYYFQLFVFSADNDTVKTDVDTFETEDAKFQNEYVDLGTGILWAKWNVGAEKVGQLGEYYAWGDLNPKSSYTAATYDLLFDFPINRDEVSVHMSLPIDVTIRYSGTGGYRICPEHEYYPDIAGTKYDVATAEWGGKWRMPTKEEWKKLSQYCNWEYVTIPGTSVKGFKVSNKMNSSQCIYLPAGGYKKGTSVSGSGTTANYWSSTLWTYNDASFYGQNVFDMKCKSTEISNRNFADYLDRFYGCLVRPVMDK